MQCIRDNIYQVARRRTSWTNVGWRSKLESCEQIRFSFVDLFFILSLSFGLFISIFWHLTLNVHHTYRTLTPWKYVLAYTIRFFHFRMKKRTTTTKFASIILFLVWKFESNTREDGTLYGVSILFAFFMPFVCLVLSLFYSMVCLQYLL